MYPFGGGTFMHVLAGPSVPSYTHPVCASGTCANTDTGTCPVMPIPRRGACEPVTRCPSGPTPYACIPMSAATYMIASSLSLFSPPPSGPWTMHSHPAPAPPFTPAAEWLVELAGTDAAEGADPGTRGLLCSAAQKTPRAALA